MLFVDFFATFHLVTGYQMPVHRKIIPAVHTLKTGDSTLIEKKAATWGRRKGGVQTDNSGTVGGDCMVSEDLTVSIIGGNKPHS